MSSKIVCGILPCIVSIEFAVKLATSRTPFWGHGVETVSKFRVRSKSFHDLGFHVFCFPHPGPNIGWWDRLPACLLGMTGKMPVATKSFSLSAITFENRYKKLFLHF
jgi:hypothetical protein